MPKDKADSTKEAKPIRIKYIFREDYNPVYANGAYGGVNPSGEIVANFYFQRHALPNEENIYPDRHEQLPEELEHTAIRFVENGVILSVDTAKQLAMWLLQKAEEAQNLTTKAVKEDGEKHAKK